MATKQSSTSKTRINPLLAEQGEYAVQEARDVYEAMKGSKPSTYVGISDERQGALDQILAQARGGGTGVSQMALDEYQKTMRGEYLNANPYLDEVARRAAQSAGGAQISGFAQSGRFGGGAMGNAMADAMMDTTSKLYGDNYQKERDRMTAMLDRTGTIDDLQYADANRIAGVGHQVEQDQIAQAQEALNLWNQDATTLSQFLKLLTGNPLMGEVTTTMNSSTMDPMKIASGAAGALGGMA